MRLQDRICKKLLITFLAYKIYLLLLCLTYNCFISPSSHHIILETFFFKARIQAENKVLEILIDKHLSIIPDLFQIYNI